MHSISIKLVEEKDTHPTNSRADFLLEEAEGGLGPSVGLGSSWQGDRGHQPSTTTPISLQTTY